MVETMIGLSLSFCVRDIALGKVKLEQVERIVTGTAAATPEAWEELLAVYKEIYWSDCPEECERIARILYEEGKIEQPRLSGEEARNIAAGHWLVDGVQIRL